MKVSALGDLFLTCTYFLFDPQGALSDKEGALNNMLSWRLMPKDEYYTQVPPPPCLVYGAHHLLRLFGKD